MKIETQPQEDQQVKIIAEIEPEKMEGFKIRAARKISRNSKISGFRPGKAPYDVVRRQYGDAVIEQEAVEIMLDELYPQILDEAGIKPSAAGTLEEIISMDPPKFSFVVPIEPEVILSDYRTIRKAYTPEPVSEDEYNKVIKNLQKNFATAEPVEGRPIEEGDLVYLMVNGEYVKPEDEENNKIVEDMPFQALVEKGEENKEEWPFPGFGLELIGAKENDEVIINHKFEEDTVYDNLKGKEVVFKVTVQSIKHLSLPVIDDEFAKSVGEYENLEALDKEVRDQLEREKNQSYDDGYFSEIIGKIVDESTVKYPKHMLDEEIHQILHAFEHDLGHQQMDLDTYLKTRKLEKEAFIDQEIKPDAEKRLKRTLVLEKIGSQEKIALDTKQLQSEVQATMINYLQNGYKMPKIARERDEFTNYITYQAANRLLNKGILDRLKLIAMGEFVEDSETSEKDTPSAEEVTEKAPAKEKKSRKKAAETAEETPKAEKPVKKAAKKKTDEQ